jgi:hypothetical protein
VFGEVRSGSHRLTIYKDKKYIQETMLSQDHFIVRMEQAYQGPAALTVLDGVTEREGDEATKHLAGRMMVNRHSDCHVLIVSSGQLSLKDTSVSAFMPAWSLEEMQQAAADPSFLGQTLLMEGVKWSADEVGRPL